MIHTSTRRHGRVYRFYACSKALKHGAKACPGSRAPMGELDAFVVERIREIGRDPRVLKATLAADRADREARRPELQADVRRLVGERARLQAEREDVLAAIERGTTGLVGRLAELDRLLADADEGLQAARGELATLDVGVVDSAELRRTLEEFEPVWDQLVPKERGRLLALWLERVVFNAESGDVAITLRRSAPAPVRPEHLNGNGHGARPPAGEPLSQEN
jgi:hypothetical protein